MSAIAHNNKAVYKVNAGTAKLDRTQVVANRDKLGAANTQVEVARVGDVEAGKFSKTEISVKSDAHVVNVKGGSYSQSNHYIRQSRGYVKKDGKLRQFINFPRMVFLFGVYSFFAIFAFLHWIAGLIVFIISFLWFLVFCQHLHVLHGTLRYVLKQPVVSIEEQSYDNWFYKIELSKLEGVYLQAKEKDAGVIIRAEGAIKLQVFNTRAKHHMSNCTTCSILMFLCTIVQLFWSLGWMIASLALGGIVITAGPQLHA